MLKDLKPALLLLLVMTVLTGVAYPLIVTGIAQAVFPRQANGSLMQRDGKAVGSELIGQPFGAPKYFWSRPSGTSPYPYNASSSSGSNQGPLNPAPTEYQVARVARARGTTPDRVRALVADSTERRQLGFLGEPRVNVLKLNLTLDALR